jgi:hypothetical protein
VLLFEWFSEVSAAVTHASTERSGGGEHDMTTCVYDLQTSLPPLSMTSMALASTIPCHRGTVAIYSAGSPRPTLAKGMSLMSVYCFGMEERPA